VKGRRKGKMKGRVKGRSCLLFSYSNCCPPQLWRTQKALGRGRCVEWQK
jgi:hypothetical protein